MKITAKSWKVTIFDDSGDTFWCHFENRFHVNSMIENDASIYGENVVKNDEETMRTWSGQLIFFEKCIHGKTSFLKKLNVRKSYGLSNRMRVTKVLAKLKNEKNEKRIWK